jgi:glycine/D-amino acid oxidase-like deaminating enzyme
MSYGHFGLDYLTQNVKTGELFYGGGLEKGIDGGLRALGNPNDSDAQEDNFTAFHLKTSLPQWFGLENWGHDDIDSRVKSKWVGVMGFTVDSLPFVGRVPVEGNKGEEWIAAGFNGYGMVNCWGSGKALAAMMLGQSPPETFPESYILTEERLAKMKVDGVVEGLLGEERK